jgi:hypothetical protein
MGFCFSLFEKSIHHVSMLSFSFKKEGLWYHDDKAEIQIYKNCIFKTENQQETKEQKDQTKWL